MNKSNNNNENEELDIEKNFEFRELSGGYEINKYLGKSRDAIIPKYYNNKPVISIYDRAFYGKLLNSVVIPDSIINIGWGAFSNNKLTSLELPDSVKTIGWGAFSDNKIKKVTVPDSVEYIGRYIFSNNSFESEKDIKLGKGFTMYYLFDENTGTIADYIGGPRKITIPDKINGKDVKRIKGNAFSYNQLKSVFIPDSVEYIGRGAFSYNPKIEIVCSENSAAKKYAVESGIPYRIVTSENDVKG